MLWVVVIIGVVIWIFLPILPLCIVALLVIIGGIIRFLPILPLVKMLVKIVSLVIIAGIIGFSPIPTLVKGVVLFIIALLIILEINTYDEEVRVEKLKSDARLNGAKVFQRLQTPIAINEEGNIGIITPLTREAKVFNIKDVNGFEVIIDGQNIANFGGVIVEGVLFGGIGAIVGSSVNKQEINSIDLLFKINDFNNPIINVPLLSYEIEKGSMAYQTIQQEIAKLTSTLEIVEKKVKGQQ
ncbi:MAG: hypothetical protein LBU73_06850 [Helicobacteraceae bacterium]|jgi:hypothetical protein|nr:hypothetical protein [Helicobacteraceae bacterium]